jgi:ElaB/YqjD/DUF883 family membrane-anchored ribosome-binding protein
MNQRRQTLLDERDPEAIRADIEATSAEIDETVEELKERFSPDRLKERLVEDVRSATLGRAKQMINESTEKAKDIVNETTEKAKDILNEMTEEAKEWGTTAMDSLRSNVVTRTIIDNPVPAALAGIGLAWLILRGPHTNGYGMKEMEWEAGPVQEGEEAGSLRARAGTVLEGARERAGETLKSVRGQAEETVGVVRERAGEVLGQAREKGGQIVGQARERIDRIGEAARDRAVALKGRYQDTLESRPMALIAGAFALGMVLGFSIPESRREHMLLGETKEKFLRRAKGVAQETIEKAERAVSDVQSSGKAA